MGAITQERAKFARACVGSSSIVWVPTQQLRAYQSAAGNYGAIPNKDMFNYFKK